MFIFDFDKEFYNFTRPIRDMQPYEIVRQENKAIIVHNVLGISKDDISVTVEKVRNADYLIISGDTKNEITNKTYSVNSRFSINADEIKGIEWYVKDGLVIVEIEFKKPEKPKIEIKYKE